MACLTSQTPHLVQVSALKGARSELEQATQQKVAALVALSDAQMTAGRADDHAERAQRQSEGLKAQLEEVHKPWQTLAPLSYP